MIEIFPEGFEEIDRKGGIELAAYTDAAGEERMWAFFGGGRAADVEAGWEDRWRAFHQPVRVGRPVGRAAVGTAGGRRTRGRDRSWARLRDRVAPDDTALSRCAAGARARLASRCRLRLRRPLCRGRAARLRSRRTAVDVEAPSVEATLANAAENGVTIDVRLVTPAERLPRADVVVANISLESVEALTPRIECTTLITSGYLASETPALPGFEHVARRTLDGWACDVSRAT